MFNREQKRHIEFLERLKAQLDEALKPREWPSMHAEMTAACLAKQRVGFNQEIPRT